MLGGTGNIISGNHCFQGDSETDGLRSAGLIFTQTNGKSTITGNYIDNCCVEWGNEHDGAPELNGEFSFHGMTITGNIFFSSGSAPWFRFITIKPYGPDHYINGFTISDNLFKQTNGQALDRVEMVDDSNFPLDIARTRGLLMIGNTFHGITQSAGDPISTKVVAATEEQAWEADLVGRLPFGGMASTILTMLPEGPVTDAGDATVYTMPYATVQHGVDGTAFRLNWSAPVKGTVVATASSNGI